MSDQTFEPGDIVMVYDEYPALIIHADINAANVVSIVDTMYNDMGEVNFNVKYRHLSPFTDKSGITLDELQEAEMRVNDLKAGIQKAIKIIQEGLGNAIT